MTNVRQVGDAKHTRVAHVYAFNIFLLTVQKKREKEEAEKKWLEEMSEDEYDALSEQEKIDVDRKRLNQKKEKMKREVEEKLERERKEKEQLALLEEKRLEEERYGKLYLLKLCE